MSKNIRSLSVLVLLFFMWGFITCLNDILIPYLKLVFDLSNFQSTLVQFAFFGAYFIGSVMYFLYSLKYGDPINKVGYKKGIQFGLLLAAIGCALFIPASILKVYSIFLMALFVLGLGLTALQISANPLVTLIGDPDTSSSRLNLAQGFNSFGTTIAPALGGYFIFEYFAEGGIITEENIRIPYLFLAAAFLVLMGIIYFSYIPSYTVENEREQASGFEVMKFKQLFFGVFSIFCYVGAEVAIGSLLINYMGLESVAGFDEMEATRYLVFYWGGAMIGRFLGAINISDLPVGKKLLYSLPTAFGAYLLVLLTSGLALDETWPYIIYLLLNFLLSFVIGNRADKILLVFSVINIVLIVLALNGVFGSFWPLLAIGLFNSIMWSNIFSLAIKGLGKYTSQGSSLLVMAILGGALIPPLQGLIADNFSFSLSFLAPAACYAYLAFYGMSYKKLYIPSATKNETMTPTISDEQMVGMDK